MFADLAGNNTAKAMLRKLLGSGRIPNALLFTGEDGLGKKLFALEVARTFMCTSNEGNEACGKCSGCLRTGVFVYPPEEDKKKEEFKRVIFGEHPDVGMVIPYKRNILVDSIRDLEKESNFRPYEARARVFLIDHAEKMNAEASNALLKTLEEPSATTHIFLITSKPMSLLPTILSRCQKVNFAPVDAAEVEQLLLNTKKYSPEDAALLSKFSRGSIGKALAIEPEKYITMRATMLDVLQYAISHRNIAGLLRKAEELNNEKNKEGYEQNLEILQTLIHDIWLLTKGLTPENLVNADLADSLSELASSARSDLLNRWEEAIERLRENLQVNVNRKIATDELFLRMAKV